MAWRFESKDDYIAALRNKEEHAYTMAQRWEKAIAEREPGGKVQFAYIHPVGINTAKGERTRHFSRAAAFRLAADMAQGLPPHD